MAIGVLLAAVVGASVAAGRRRAFWLGFAVFGWAYGVLAFGPWLRDEIRPRLLTSTAIDVLGRALAPMPPEKSVPPSAS